MKGVVLAVGALVGVLVLAAVALSGPLGILWLGFGSTLIPLDFIDRYYLSLPGSVRWLPEVATVVAACATLVLWPRSRRPLPRGPALAYAFIAVEALGSMVFNGTSPVALVLSQRGFVMLFGTLILLRAVERTHDRDRLYAWIVGAGIASSVVCFLQRVTIARSDGDRVTGLFSFGEVVLFYHLVAIGIVLAYWLEGRRVGRWNTGWALVLLVLSLGIGNQEAALPYMLLVLGWLFVRARARRGPLLAIGVGLPTVMLVVFTVIYDSQYKSREGSYSKAIFEPRYVLRYVFGEGDDVLTPSGDLLRGAAVVTAAREISDGTKHLLLGRGPGATTESGVAGVGELAAEYPGIGRVTLSILLGDTGWLGVLGYVLLLVAVLRARGPPGVQEPHEHAVVRELVVLLAFAYLIYMRMTFEPSYAWILACVVHAPAGAGRGVAGGTSTEGA